MSMQLPLPGAMSRQEPGSVYKPPEQYVFDHIPGLPELLPQFRGIPGFEYFQCCVVNLKRAQEEGWVEVINTVVYTVEGPKGRTDMKLLARGNRVPGASHNSGARLCRADLAVQELTGLWINPNRHKDDETDLGEKIEAALQGVTHNRVTESSTEEDPKEDSSTEDSVARSARSPDPVGERGELQSDEQSGQEPGHVWKPAGVS